MQHEMSYEGNRACDVPHSAGSQPPRLKAPELACDCHMHIFDPRFPASAHWTRVPPEATVDDYRLFQQRIGTSRTVVVTPSTYGTDNACTLDAVARMGGSARAVVVVDATVSEAELKQMSGKGVCGIRVNFVSPQSWGVTTAAMLIELSRRLHALDLGWHVQIFMHGQQIVEMENVLASLPTTLVIDHIGRVPQPAGTSHPALGAIRRLLDGGKTWVKLSGAYMDTQEGASGYIDVGRVAKEFVHAAPERLVWGSDWPHTIAESLPDDAVLFDLNAEWIPNVATRNRILVDNPQTLYRF